MSWDHDPNSVLPNPDGWPVPPEKRVFGISRVLGGRCRKCKGRLPPRALGKMCEKCLDDLSTVHMAKELEEDPHSRRPGGRRRAG
jgi:hypothetical protein